MRIAFVTLPLLALAACATPREACISQGTRDLRSVERQLAQSELALSRGWVTETRERFGWIEETCEGVDDAGEPYTYECREPGWVEAEVRVPVNRQAEQARRDALAAQRDALLRQAQPLIAACTAAHPE